MTLRACLVWMLAHRCLACAHMPIPILPRCLPTLQHVDDLLAPSSTLAVSTLMDETAQCQPAFRVLKVRACSVLIGCSGMTVRLRPWCTG